MLNLRLRSELYRLELYRTDLYSSAKRFPYGKRLACEALNKIFPCPDKKQQKTLSDGVPDVSLFSSFRKWSTWTHNDWIKFKNWKEVRDVLGKAVFPNVFRKYSHHGFKLSGTHAGAFGTETLEFVKTLSSRWRGGRMNATVAAEIQSSIDLLEMVIKDSLVDASVRKDWIKSLVELCQRYRRMPKALELDGLSFPSYAKNSMLDCGGSADILLAELDGKKVVVKVLRMDKAIRAKMRRKEWSPLHEEALNWIGLDYPGLNPFLGITLKHPRSEFGIGLVFKFQELGNSIKYLEKHQIDRVDFVQAKSFYFVGAVHFLHQMGLIHGDIKGCNILVDEKKNLVLTDFGLMLRVLLHSPSSTPASITASSDATSSASLGGDYTLRFASKERILDGKRTEGDEIWAIGMTLIELLTGKPPFTTRYRNDACFFIALSKLQVELKREDLPASVPDELFHAIKRCISPNPADRPSAFELFSIMGKIAGGRALKGIMSEGYS